MKTKGILQRIIQNEWVRAIPSLLFLMAIATILLTPIASLIAGEFVLGWRLALLIPIIIPVGSFVFAWVDTYTFLLLEESEEGE